MIPSAALEGRLTLFHEGLDAFPIILAAPGDALQVAFEVELRSLLALRLRSARGLAISQGPEAILLCISRANRGDADSVRARKILLLKRGPGWAILRFASLGEYRVNVCVGDAG